jgi:hypothetical protein
MRSWLFHGYSFLSYVNQSFGGGLVGAFRGAREVERTKDI